MLSYPFISLSLSAHSFLCRTIQSEDVSYILCIMIFYTNKTRQINKCLSEQSGLAPRLTANLVYTACDVAGHVTGRGREGRDTGGGCEGIHPKNMRAHCSFPERTLFPPHPSRDICKEQSGSTCAHSIHAPAHPSTYLSRCFSLSQSPTPLLTTTKESSQPPTRLEATSKFPHKHNRHPPARTQ